MLAALYGGPGRDQRQIPRLGGTMAHRRRLISRRATLLACGGLLLVVMLVGMVFLSNQVTGLRRSLTDLQDDRQFLEARAARLLQAWNTATRPEAICGRARRELGLVLPSEPQYVLVLRPPAGGERSGGGPRSWTDWPVASAVASAAASPDVSPDILPNISPARAAGAAPPGTVAPEGRGHE